MYIVFLFIRCDRRCYRFSCSQRSHFSCLKVSSAHVSRAHSSAAPLIDKRTANAQLSFRFHVPTTPPPVTPFSTTRPFRRKPMWLTRLKRTLHAFLISFTRPLIRFARIMREDDFRWSFGPRPPVPGEEAARPLLPQQEVAFHQATVVTGNETQPLLQDNGEDSHDLAHATETWDADGDPFMGAYTTLHQSLSNHFSNESQYHTHPHFIGSSHSNMGSFFDRMVGSNATADGIAGMDGAQDPEDHTMTEAPPVTPANISQPEFDEPPLTLSHQDNIDLERILTPVLASLQRLKDTTPERLPDYNARIKTKSHAQVLKIRLADIGKHIQSVLEAKAKKGMSDREQATLELKLW